MCIWYDLYSIYSIYCVLYSYLWVTDHNKNWKSSNYLFWFIKNYCSPYVLLGCDLLYIKTITQLVCCWQPNRSCCDISRTQSENCGSLYLLCMQLCKSVVLLRQPCMLMIFDHFEWMTVLSGEPHKMQHYVIGWSTHHIEGWEVKGAMCLLSSIAGITFYLSTLYMRQWHCL